MATRRCMGCGRPLRSAVSIKREYGVKCWEQLTGEVKEERERVMSSIEISEDDPAQTYVLRGGDKNNLHQREEALIEKVLGTQYMPYRQMFPGALTVMIDVDVIMYQGAGDPDEHRSCDLYAEALLFREIKTELVEVARLRDGVRRTAGGAVRGGAA